MADYNGLIEKLDVACAEKARHLASVDALWRIISNDSHYYTPFCREGYQSTVDLELGGIVDAFKKAHPEAPVNFHPQPSARYQAVQKGLSAKEKEGRAFLLYTRQTLAMQKVKPDNS